MLQWSLENKLQSHPTKQLPQGVQEVFAFQMSELE